MSARHIHIAIGPQFEFCWNTAILADFTSMGLWLSHSVAGMLSTLRLLDAEDEKHCCDRFECRYPCASQDGITLQKTFEP
jgi:hypothetical protein